jgi:hypothetical protein
MRDEKWLFEKLDEVWDTYFSDVPQDNDVRIVWGRRARSRLGSIKQIPNTKSQASTKIQNTKFKIQNSVSPPATVITINSLFKDEKIPEYIVIGTIAHELAHYAHGFHSPLEQKYATPHAGGIVHKEMSGRGLDNIHKKQKRWLKENWRNYIMDNLPPRPRDSRRVVVKWF